MRLIFDQNLSFKLVALLADDFPGSTHVREVNLAEAGGLDVWEYARDNDLVIVSKDEVFHQLSFLHGPPPKVVWLRLGNCTTADITADIEEALGVSRSDLAEFCSESEGAFFDCRQERIRLVDMVAIVLPGIAGMASG